MVPIPPLVVALVVALVVEAATTETKPSLITIAVGIGVTVAISLVFIAVLDIFVMTQRRGYIIKSWFEVYVQVCACY